MKPLLIAALFASLLGAPAQPEYSIQAIRYATAPDVPVSELVIGGPKDVKIDIAMVVWLIRGGGHTILFDSGFHRDTFLKDFPMKDYLRPDEAVKTAGVQSRGRDGHRHQPRALGPHGRHRPVPQGNYLDSEGRISLLHHGRVAAGRRSRRHRSRRRQGTGKTKHGRPHPSGGWR